MSFIQTVTGKIPQEEMGVTYCHDHLLFMPPNPYIEKDPTLKLDDLEKSIQEVKYFRMSGGNCIVEMSTVDTGRSPAGLKEISQKTGVQIIAATGFNKSIYSESLTANKTIEEISKKMVNDLNVGMDGGDIKAGVIKASSSKNMFSPGEEKVFQAAAIAYHETGATISTHTEAGTMAMEQILKLKKCGVSSNSIVIGHLDRKLEWDYLSTIAKEGVYMSFDQISKEKYYPDALRIEMIKKLIAAGFGNQIMLSGDLARMSYLPSYGFGYGPGYTYILWRFIPWMIEAGVSREDINKILVENPAAAFSWK